MKLFNYIHLILPFVHRFDILAVLADYPRQWHLYVSLLAKL